MIKYFCWLIICSSYIVTKAQNSSSIDSLFLVKNYLLTLQHTVENKQLSNTIKVQQLDSLVKKASGYQVVLNTHLQKIHYTDTAISSMLQQYRLIIQSAILLKTDLRQNGYQNTAGSSAEIYYLYRHIPAFVHRIYQATAIQDQPE